MDYTSEKDKEFSTEVRKHKADPVQSKKFECPLKLLKQLNMFSDSNHSFSSLFKNIRDCLYFDQAVLYIVESGQTHFKQSESLIIGANPPLENSLPLSEGFEAIIKSHKTYICQKNDTQPNMKSGYKSQVMVLLLAPILVGSECIGAIRCDRLQNVNFYDYEIEFINLIAGQLAVKLSQSFLENKSQFLEKQSYRMMEGVNIPLFFCNRNGQLSKMNQPLIDLFGFRDKNDSLQINLFEQIILYPSKKNTFQQLMNKCGYFKNLEVQLRKCDNEIITVLINIIPIRDFNRKIIGYEGTIQDISEKRELEAQLLQAQKLGALGSLVGGIAHDFNNLIGGIMGCASLLITDVPKESPHYKDVRTILNASQKAAELSAQLLSYTRKEKQSKKTIIVNNIISEVIHLLSRTINKSIQINANLTPEIYPIEANTTQIQQALMNICINARDAMPEGGQLTIQSMNVKLEEKDVKKCPPGHYVCIKISDTGIGMNKTTMNKIFESFFTTKPKNQGNGLGLATASEIIKNHDGFIRVNSQLKIGSTFIIYIPVSLKKVDPEIEHFDIGHLPRGSETILLVDDEEVIREMGKRMLGMFGYQVLLAQNGKEAVEIYRKSFRKIHLLILDMIMPKMNGKQTLIKCQHINPKVKALLASGYESSEKSDEHLNDGFSGYIKKPFMASEMLKMVRKTLGESCSLNS